MKLAAASNKLANENRYCDLQSTVPYPLSWDQTHDQQEDLHMASYLVSEVIDWLNMHDFLLENYQSICSAEQIEPDHIALQNVNEIKKLMQDLIARHRVLLSQSVKIPQEHFEKMISLDQIYRSLLNLQVPAARLLSWSSQVYKASKIAQFFNGAKTKKEDVNYDRWQTRRVTQVERQMLKVYDFDSEQVNLLMASSGAAAYNVLEKYLLLHVVQPNEKILIVPNMFDEQQDWVFRDIPYLKVITEDFFKTEDIVDSIIFNQPKVVFIDPLKNMQEARSTDVIEVIKKLSIQWKGDDLYIVIDDTMLPAAMDPFKAAQSNDKLKIMLFCSCAKYMQLGQDNCMAGLLAFPVDMSKRMKNIRMYHGTILSDSGAWSYPSYNRQFHIWRMKRMTRNALVMAKIFKETPGFSQHFLPVFPGLPDHPDYETSKQFDFLAGTLNLRMLPRVPNPKEDLHNILDEMLVAVIMRAKDDGVSIAWGEATGFGTSRMQVYFEYLWRIPPFLRISVGDRSLKETEEVAKSIANGLLKYMESNKDKFRFGPEDQLNLLSLKESIEEQRLETGYFDQGAYLKTATV